MRDDSVNSGKQPLLPFTKDDDVVQEENSRNQLGTINGVYVPCLLNILGAVLFLRIGYAVGYAGVVATTLIFVVSFSTTVCTTLSFSTIVTNGKMKGGGPYYMISRAMGPSIGGATGIIFYMCYVFNCAFNAIAFVECIQHTVISHGGTWPGYAFPALYHSTLVLLGVVAYGGAGCFSKVNTMLFAVLMLSIIITFVSLLTQNDNDGDGQIISSGPINCTSDTDSIMDTSDSYYFGNLINATYYGPSSGKLRQNLFPHHDVAKIGDPRKQVSGWDTMNNLPVVVSLIFTSTCGVLEGANLSGDLKDPARSLPKGTLRSDLTAFTTYITFAWLLAASFDSDSLRCDYFVLQEICVSEYVVVIGMGMATLSTSLGALFGGARVLQAIARDAIIPVGFFGKGSRKGDEPERAVLLTWVMANFAAYLGGSAVNSIAVILTDFFLTAYLSVNVSALVLQLTNAPNWRPGFTFTRWYMSLLGCILATTMMWYLSWVYALTTTGIWLVLFVYIYNTVGDKHAHWGDIGNALRYRFLSANAQKFSVRTQKGQASKYWRSNVILLAEAADVPALHFCRAVTQKEAGLFLVGTAVVGTEWEEAERKTERSESTLPQLAARVKEAWSSVAHEDEVGAMSVVGAGSDPLDVYSTLISSAGLGGLIPHTVIVPLNGRRIRGDPSQGSGCRILEWATETSELKEDARWSDHGLGLGDAHRHVSLLRRVMQMQKNLLLLRGMSRFDALLANGASFIDVWVVGAVGSESHYFNELFPDVLSVKDLNSSDFSLRIQFAHLLQRAHSDCSQIRIIQLAPPEISEELLQAQEEILLDMAKEARVQLPEVKVIRAPAEMALSVWSSTSGLNPEQAKQYLRSLNKIVKENSAKTSATFLPLPPLPDTDGEEGAKCYLDCIEDFTNGLPPTVVCSKQQKMDILSSGI